MTTFQRSKSESLFEFKNREELHKLRLKTAGAAVMRPLFSLVGQKKTSSREKDIARPQTQQYSSHIARINMNTSSKDRVKVNSVERKMKCRSATANKCSQSKLLSHSGQTKQRNAQKSLQKKEYRGKEQFQYRTKTVKTALRIERSKDFKSAIPRYGFVEGSQKIQSNYKEHGVIISCNGVLLQNREGWQFKTHKNYELQLKTLQKIVQLQFFRYFYKLKTFNKWKRLTKCLNQNNIARFLSHTVVFNPNNVIMVLKQQRLFCQYFANMFLASISPSHNEISYENYSNYLFTGVANRLRQFKLNSFEQFFMHLIVNLRKIIKQHEIFDNQQFDFKLSDHAFQDYFTRQNIQDHQAILLKFLYRYEEIKIEVILKILNQIQNKIKYNIDKWKQNFTEGNSLLDIVQILFSDKTVEKGKDMDICCFQHDIKIKQIALPLLPSQQLPLNKIKQLSTKFLTIFVDRVKCYLRQKYKSYYNCQSQLINILRTLLTKQLISSRQYDIAIQTLSKINIYCFAQNFKLYSEQIQQQITKINEIIHQNLQLVVTVIQLIQTTFLNKADAIVGGGIHYQFDYCMLIQKLRQRISKYPVKLRMGLFCLDLTSIISHYDSWINQNYKIIVDQCIKIYTDKILSIAGDIATYDGRISISSWKINEFICSYNSSHDYNSYFQTILKDKLKDLDSILLTIHRTQPRYYEQAYLDLFHLKENSENTKSKSICFLREISHKLSYLATEKDVRSKQISNQIDKIQREMQDLVKSDWIEFKGAFTMLNQINQKLQIQGNEIEEIATFIEIQKSYSMRQGKQLQFLTYDKLKNQITFLLKLINNYKQFSDSMNSQLERNYLNFRLQLLVDSIHNEIAIIKQSIRFLHHYQKFLLNISSFYQSQNAKIRLLRLIMQLDAQDLIKLDKKNFNLTQNYSGFHMLNYLQSNEVAVRQYISQKQCTNRLKQKIIAIETRLTKFVLVNSSHHYFQGIHSDLSNFIQTLQRNETDLQVYMKNDHLKEMRNQISDFVDIIKKSIKFLLQYMNIYDIYTTYQSYLKEPSGQKIVQNKFSNIFREHSKQISQIRLKWAQLNEEIVELNLKNIIQYKYDVELERVSSLQQLIKSEISKINLYITKKIQQFPLFNLFTTEILINIINNPLLFIQYFHKTVKDVKLIYLQTQQPRLKANLITSTIYGQKIIITLQGKQSKDKNQQNEPQQLKIDLSWCMNQISSIIKNNIINLQGTFQYFIEVIQNQSIPLQVIFATDQIHNYHNLLKLKNNTEVLSVVQKQLTHLLSCYKNKQGSSTYNKLLIDILLVSKMEFKNKLNCYPFSEILEHPCYQRIDDELVLHVYHQSLKVDYQLVDSMKFSILEPVNHRTSLKLFQSLIQVRSMLLFEPYGLINVSCRLMKHLVEVYEDQCSFQKALNITVRESVLFFYKNTGEGKRQFFKKISRAFDALNHSIEERQKRIKARIGSTKHLVSYKPMLFLQISPKLYKMQNKINFDNFSNIYRELSAQKRVTFRVIQLCQPSTTLILKLSLLKFNIQLQDQLQKQILQQFIKYEDNKFKTTGHALNHQDTMLVLQEIIRNLILYEKPEPQHVALVFSSMEHNQLFQRRSQKRKTTVIFKTKNNTSKNRKSSQSLLKFEETKLHLQFIRFSKQMDQLLPFQDTVLIVGRPCCGKSYMLRLYAEIVNTEVRNQKQKGKTGGKLMKLQGIDLSLIEFDPLFLQNQIINLQQNSQTFNYEFVWMLWLDGLQKLSANHIDYIISKKWLMGIEQYETKTIFEVANLKLLSPSVILQHRKIVLKQKCFSFLEIVHNKKQQIMHLLSGGCFPKIIDPFSIFNKILTNFFTTMRNIHRKLFIIQYEEEMFVIQTFDLLIGIIKNKLPNVLDQFQSMNQSDKNQVLRKLFIFCFLWITLSLVQETVSKKYQDYFLQLCKQQKIDIQSVGSNFIINHKSEGIQYLQIKNAKNTILKSEQTVSHHTIFIETYQTILLKNLIHFITCNPMSKVSLFGDNQIGKTAFLHNFTTTSKDNNRFSYISSLHTFNCIRELNRSLKQMNSTYERQKIQEMLKDEDNKKGKWYMNLAKTKCVFIENVGLDMWQPVMSYFKFITQQQIIYVQGESCEFRNMHLLIERGSKQPYLDEQMHYLPVKIGYDESYYNQVFYGIYDIVCKNSILNHQTCYETLKIKGVIIKNLLNLMKMTAKKVKQSTKNWMYYYPLSTLKSIFMEMKHKHFKTKNQFIQSLMHGVQYQISLRLRDQVAKITFSKLFQNCRQHIKQDLKEDFGIEQPQMIRNNEDQIVTKLTNYLQYKNQFKNLKKSKSLIRNLTRFYHALNRKPLLIINHSLIPGVGQFLPIAAQILRLQLIEITSLEHMKLMTVDAEKNSEISKTDEIIIYHIPSWLLKNKQILAYLCNKARNLQNFLPVRKGRRISEILGSSTHQNKCYFVLQYSKTIQKQELNILKFEQLMKGSTFLQIQSPDRLEEEDELRQYLGKQREELEVRENQIIVNKIKRIYELFQNQELFHKMNPDIRKYIFSIENYYRFIKVIIDTYFERKYELKSNLHLIQLANIRIQGFLQEYKEIKTKNIHLKDTLNQIKKKIAMMDDMQKAFKQNLHEYLNNPKYLELKDKRKKMIQFQKLKQKLVSKQQSLLESIQIFKNIPRSEIANLKSLFSTSQSSVKSLFECLSILINESDDISMLKKTMLDINLSMRIKQITFADKKEQTMRTIQDKLAQTIIQNQQSKGSQNIINWLKYSVQYYFFKNQFNLKLVAMEKEHMTAFSNFQAMEIQVKIQKLSVEVDQMSDRLQKERVNQKQIQNQLKQSQVLIRGLQKFQMIENFRTSCIKQKETLQKQYKFSLQSSIYFSIKLNFIFPCDLGAGNSINLYKGKQKYDSFRGIMQRIFVKWCGQVQKDIELNFFKKQIQKIFQNKQKYYFIDKELDNEEWNVIAKCKKIGTLNGLIESTYPSANGDICAFFIPNIIFNKFLFLKYLLNIKHNNTKILVIDPFWNVLKYLELSAFNRVLLKRSLNKNESASQKYEESSFLTSYYLKSYDSVILNTMHNILFVQVPTFSSRISLKQMKRQSNSGWGFMLKINSCEYLVPYYQNFRIIYISRQILRDSSAMSEFFMINFQQNSIDCLQMMKNQILRFQMNKMQGVHSLFQAIKYFNTSITSNEYYIRKLINSFQKWHYVQQLNSHKRQLKFQVIQKCCIKDIRQKITIRCDDFFNKMIAMIQKWKIVNDEYVLSHVNLQAISQYSDKFISPFSQKMLMVYRNCYQIDTKIQPKYISINSQHLNHHNDLTFLMSRMREGLKFSHHLHNSSSLEFHMLNLQKFILDYYCNYAHNNNVFTISLFLKIYSLQTEVATGYQVLNLHHDFNYDNFIESLIQYKVDSYAQGVHQELAVYKLEIQKFLKSFKDIRHGKADGGIHIRNKNYTINPSHINELIQNFQFKIIRKDNQDGSNKSLQSFRKLSPFTQLLLQKILVPKMFLKSAQEMAMKWKKEYLNLQDKLIEYYLTSGTCVYFCEIKWWSIWFSRFPMKDIEVIKITEMHSKIQDKLKERTNFNKLCLVLDERECPREDKNEGMLRLRLQEYLNIYQKNIIILSHNKFHGQFYEVVKAEAKTAAKKGQSKSLHCMLINQFYSLLKRFSTKQFKQQILKMRKASIQSIHFEEEPQTSTISKECSAKWKSIKKKLLSKLDSSLQSYLIEPYIDQFQIQIDDIYSLGPTKCCQIMNTKMSIWEHFNNYELEHCSNYVTFTNQPKTHSRLPFKMFPILSSDQSCCNYSESRLQYLMNSLIKNRSSIIAYIKNKINAKYKIGIGQNNNAVAKSKPKTMPSAVVEDMEYRYSQNVEEEQAPTEQINSPQVPAYHFKRVSRVKSIKVHQGSNIKNAQQDYQLEAYLSFKINSYINMIDDQIQKTLTFWKIYEGDLPLSQHYQHLLRETQQQDMNYQQILIYRYEKIVSLLLEFEEQLLIKDSKKVQILYNNEVLSDILLSTKNGSILSFNYHQNLRKQYEIILRCYDSDRCDDCSFLIKRKNNQKLCILLNDQLYQICVNSYYLIKDYEAPTVTIKLDLKSIIAKIYCKKIIADLT